MLNSLNNAFRRLALIAAVPLLAAATFMTPAKAQEWPKRPITIMTPFDAGGSADRLARGFAQYMSKELGQPVIVTDRPGANGSSSRNRRPMVVTESRDARGRVDRARSARA